MQDFDLPGALRKKWILGFIPCKNSVQGPLSALMAEHLRSSATLDAHVLDTSIRFGFGRLRAAASAHTRHPHDQEREAMDAVGSFASEVCVESYTDGCRMIAQAIVEKARELLAKAPNGASKKQLRRWIAAAHDEMLFVAGIPGMEPMNARKEPASVAPAVPQEEPERRKVG
jgi:hypothetical protein